VKFTCADRRPQGAGPTRRWKNPSNFAAVACGLIINELVSNSLKYGFPDGREGVVRIELTADANNMARLIVADNGVGHPNHPDLANAKTLGLRLVRTLAEQLGGTIELRANEGAEARLTFPVVA
jgi:two-component sensor histidine kinase